MVDVELKKQVQKRIQDEVKPLSDGAFKMIAAAVPALAAAMKKVDEGIRCGVSSDVLQTYKRDLVIKMREVNRARKWAVDALNALQKIAEDDEAFEADAAEIEALQAKLAKSRDLLADQVVKGKKVEDRAEAAADANDRSETSAHREWDLLVTGFERSMAQRDGLLKDLRTLKKEAEDAVKARDADALRNRQEMIANVKLDKEIAEGKQLMRRTNEFLSKYDLDSFSKDFVTEMAKDRATTIDVYDRRAAAIEQEVQKIQEAVARLAIEPPNAVKATAELGFKANFITQVRDAFALDESRWAKELETIARKAGDKSSTGKQLVEKLRKAHLL